MAAKKSKKIQQFDPIVQHLKSLPGFISIKIGSDQTRAVYYQHKTKFDTRAIEKKFKDLGYEFKAKAGVAREASKRNYDVVQIAFRVPESGNWNWSN